MAVERTRPTTAPAAQAVVSQDAERSPRPFGSTGITPATRPAETALASQQEIAAGKSVAEVQSSASPDAPKDGAAPTPAQATIQPTQADLPHPPRTPGAAQPEGEEESSAADAKFAALLSLLSQPDLILANSVFHDLLTENPEAALEALLRLVEDSGNPHRVQAVQLLLNSQLVDPDLADPAVRRALQDGGPAVAHGAIEELAGRNDKQALGLLNEIMDRGDPDTRLLLVQSVADNFAASGLVQRGLSDPDPGVRLAAELAVAPRP